MTEHATESWRHKAACREEDPELFFPLHEPESELPKWMCWNQCLVREDCARTAAKRGEKAGVWGGYYLPDEIDELKVELGITGPVRLCDTCGNRIQGLVQLRTCHRCRSMTSDPDAVRSHVARLRAADMSLHQIADASDVSRSTISEIVNGRRPSISRPAAEKILAVEPAAVNA
ncbi:WhiB family transcriptional regulator [Nocardia fluminea]|uniref:WhiB family transcriptional regulator n=1 Tax=Nocardia fluminea TaxID=134984 RepID=UPI00366720B1